MVLFSTLIQRTIRRIGQVNGTGAQVYSEDLVAEMLQHKFDVLFKEAWWDQFKVRATWTLDETTGKVTTDVSQIDNPLKEFGDILAVHRPGYSYPLPKLAHTVNSTIIEGTVARYIDPVADTTRIFRVLPITATGDVEVVYRSKPDDFVAADNVNFDAQALILGAAYDYVEDDGGNPGQAEKLLNMFESRVKQLKDDLTNQSIKLDDRLEESIPDEWFVV